MNVAKFQFSLAWLIGAVAAAALGFSLARLGNEVGFDPVIRLTLQGSLILSVAGVALRRTQRRAFWVGFVLHGWLYWFLIFGPWLGIEHQFWSQVIGFLYPSPTPTPGVPAPTGGFGTGGGPSLGQLMILSYVILTLMSLLNLLVAAVGGIVSQRLYTRWFRSSDAKASAVTV